MFVYYLIAGALPFSIVVKHVDLPVCIMLVTPVRCCFVADIFIILFTVTCTMCILQAIFSVARPDGDIFLVVRIEKVLQGSISGALEQYLRTTDVKAGTKLHKAMMPYCQRLGNYRMPFAWGAR